MFVGRGKAAIRWGPVRVNGKVERDRVAEREREEVEAFRQRVADRRVRQNAEKNAGRRKPLFSSDNPIYLTLVSLTIGLTGLSALYLVERAFS